MASAKTEAAICVQDIDVQCVLQFTLIHAAGCALHRHTSRVIHRLELYLHTTMLCTGSTRKVDHACFCIASQRKMEKKIRGPGRPETGLFKPRNGRRCSRLLVTKTTRPRYPVRSVCGNQTPDAPSSSRARNKLVR